MKSLCGGIKIKRKHSARNQRALSRQRKIISCIEDYDTEGYRKVTMTMRTEKRKCFPWR